MWTEKREETEDDSWALQDIEVRKKIETSKWSCGRGKREGARKACCHRGKGRKALQEEWVVRGAKRSLESLDSGHWHYFTPLALLYFFSLSLITLPHTLCICLFICLSYCPSSLPEYNFISPRISVCVIYLEMDLWHPGQGLADHRRLIKFLLNGFDVWLRDWIRWGLRIDHWHWQDKSHQYSRPKMLRFCSRENGRGGRIDRKQGPFLGKLDVLERRQRRGVMGECWLVDISLISDGSQ